MSSITFLASSRPFKMPEEITAYDERTEFETEQQAMYFSVQPLGDYWVKEVEGLFTLPFLYEAQGVGNHLFLTYLENYMETGDVLELYYVPNQHAFGSYKKRALEQPEPIEVNTGSRTYRDGSGLYQFHPKTWVEELSHRNYITQFGVATFVNY